jgi:hypothetical protein
MVCSTCEARLKCGAKLCAQCGTRTAVPSQISLPCRDGLARAEVDQVDRFYSRVVLARPLGRASQRLLSFTIRYIC